jgi:hypothetical protein
MSGLPTPAARTSGLVLGLAAALALAFAPAVAAQEPDLEMLEYLGSWQTEDGSAVDPFQLDEVKELEPEPGRTDVRTDEQVQERLADRLDEQRRVRKQGPALNREKDSKRRDASPGGGHE